MMCDGTTMVHDFDGAKCEHHGYMIYSIDYGRGFGFWLDVPTLGRLISTDEQLATSLDHGDWGKSFSDKANVLTNRIKNNEQRSR